MKNISPFIFLTVFFIACSNEANIERDKDFIEIMSNWKEHHKC